MKMDCIEQEYILDTEWLKVRRDWVLINDEEMIEYYITEKNDAVLIVALNENNEVLLITEYKYPINKVMTQIPAGTLIRGEEGPLEAAKRELKEETGCESDDWKLLAETHDYTTKDTHVVYIYVAKNCIKTSEQKLDKFEELSCKWVSFKDAIELVMSNEISTNGVAHALLRCAQLYPQLTDE